MPRKARRMTVMPDYPHHLVLRGNNRRRLFSYPNEYRFFLHRIWRASRRYGVAVHSIVQMTNHVHLIVTPRATIQLSKFVSGFAQPYAQFRNKRRNGSGKLFEERFMSKPIGSEEQMAVATAYVELNPVRDGLCNDAATHRWSTFRRHAGMKSLEPLIERLWTPSSWFLSLGSDPDERCGAFLDCFEHYRARDEWAEVLCDPSPLRDRKRVERPNRGSAV